MFQALPDDCTRAAFQLPVDQARLNAKHPRLASPASKVLSMMAASVISAALVMSLSLIATHAAHAAPADNEAGNTSPSSDDLDKLLLEKGLLGRITWVGQQVTQTVSNQASKVTSKASDLVVSAMGALGVPYRKGGSTFEGFDCSGFVRTMVQQTVGLVLPRKAEQQAAATQKIDKQDLQPGDLVFFNTMRRAFSHVGIYMGDGKFIHSPKPGAEVRVEDMAQPYWSRRFDGARRVQDSRSAE